MKFLNYIYMAPLVCGLFTILASPLAAQEKKDQDSAAGAPPSALDLKPSPGLAKLNGFRGFGFGTAVGEFKTLKLDQDRGPLKLYIDDNDKELIGPVLFDEIVYYFYEGKFMAVALHTSDGNDTSNTVRILEGAFGPGSALEGENTYVWKGDKEAVRLTVSPDGNGEVYISNNQLYKEFLDYEEKAVQAAIAELKTEK